MKGLNEGKSYVQVKPAFQVVEFRGSTRAYSVHYSPGHGIFHDWSVSLGRKATWIPFSITYSQYCSLVFAYTITIYSAALRCFLEDNGLHPDRIDIIKLIRCYEVLKKASDALLQDPESNSFKTQEIELFVTGFIRDSGHCQRAETFRKCLQNSPYLTRDMEDSKIERDLASIEEEFFFAADELAKSTLDPDQLKSHIAENFGRDASDRILVAAEYGQLQDLENCFRYSSKQVNGHVHRAVGTWGKLEALDLILKHNTKFPDDERLGEALLEAARKGSYPAVDTLLQHGAEPNFLGSRIDYSPFFRFDYRSNNLQTPLEIALERGHFEVAQKLLENGATVTLGIMNWLRHASRELCEEWIVDEFVTTESRVIIPERWLWFLQELPLARWNTALPYRHAIHPLMSRLYASRGWREQFIDQCPLIAEIRAKEAREKTKAKRSALSRVHDILLSKHDRFFVQSKEIGVSAELKKFARSLGTYRAVFKEGMATIRRLLNNILPETLRQVFACIQVADAMRSSVSSDIPEADGLGDDIRRWLNRDEFVQDLERWCMLLRDHEKPLFQEISLVIWDKPISSETPTVYSRKENHLYFRELLEILVSDTAQLKTSTAEPPSVGSQSGDMKAQESKSGATPPQAGLAESMDDQRCRPKLPQVAQYLQAAVVVIMAGAIFGFILVFVCLMQLGVASKVLAIETWKDTFRIFGEWNALARNCSLLLFYLGFWSISTSKDYDASFEVSVDTNATTTAQFETIEMDFNFDIDGDPLNPTFNSPGSYCGASMQEAPSTSPSAASNFDDPRPNESLPSTSVSTPGSNDSERPRCRRCQKPFKTISNRNKHERSDCKQGAQRGRFQCRNGCPSVSTRTDNRDKHERLHCRFRNMPVA